MSTEDTGTDTILDTGADTGSDNADTNSADDASNQSSDAGGTANADNSNTDKPDTWLKDDQADKPADDADGDDKGDKSDADEDAEDKDGEDSDKDDPNKDNEDGAPEEYDDFEMPEGIEVTEDTAPVMEEFKSFAKELNLSQDKAQKLVDFQTKMEVARAEKFHAEVEGWKQAAKDDKEFGGKAFDENVGMASKALGEFASPEFRELLRSSQLGNHPEVIRTFVKIGKAMGEGKTVKGGGNAAGGKKQLSDIYD